MQKQKSKTPPPIKGRKVTLDQIMDAIREDDYRGFCIACGAEAFGVEPDAEKYICETCGKPCVFGAEQLLITYVP